MQFPKWMSKKWFWGLVAVKTVIKIVIVVGLYHSAQAKADPPAAPAAQCTRFMGDAAPTGCSFFVPAQHSRITRDAYNRTRDNSIEFQFFAERTAPEQVYFRALKHFRQADGQFRADCLGNQMPARAEQRCGMNYDDFMHNIQFLATDLNQTAIAMLTGNGGLASPAMPDPDRRRTRDASYIVSVPAIGAMMVGIGVVYGLHKLRVVREGVEATAAGEARVAAERARAAGNSSTIAAADDALSELLRRNPTVSRDYNDALERMVAASEGQSAVAVTKDGMSTSTAIIRRPTYFARVFGRFMDWVTGRRSQSGMGAFARLVRKGTSLNLNTGHLMVGVMFGAGTYYTLKAIINEHMNQTRFRYEAWLGQWLPLSNMGINTVHGRTPDIALLGVNVAGDGTMTPVDQTDSLLEQIRAINQEGETQAAAEAAGARAPEGNLAQNTAGLVTAAPRPQATQARPNIFKLPDMGLVEQSTRAFFHPKNQCLGSPYPCDVGFFEVDYTSTSEARNPDLRTPLQAP